MNSLKQKVAAFQQQEQAKAKAPAKSADVIPMKPSIAAMFAGKSNLGVQVASLPAPSTEDDDIQHVLANWDDKPTAGNKPPAVNQDNGGKDEGTAAPAKPAFRPYVMSSSGKVLAVQENTEIALDNEGVTVRYNVISKQVEIVIPDHSGTMDNADNVTASKAHDVCTRQGLTLKDSEFSRHILAIADANRYNPFATWLMSEPWDGISRVDTYFDSIQVHAKAGDTKPDQFKRLGMLRWSMSILAAALQPDGLNGGGVVLTFVGNQGEGKTRWLAELFPKHLNLYGEGAIDPDDKDSIDQCICYLVYELGEIDATFRKADISKLKAFLSRRVDKYRRPYAKSASAYPRRTVCGGSVNEFEFLADQTGNRRFWPAWVKAITQLPNDDRWKQQLWRELHDCYYAKGERWWLDKSEIDQLATHNEKFTPADPIEEKLRNLYDFDAAPAMWGKALTATAICEAVGVVPDTRNCKAVGRIIRTLWRGDHDAVSERTNKGRLLKVPPIHGQSAGKSSAA